MRRLLAMFAFLMGGLAAELKHPVQCSLVHASQAHVKRRKP